MSDKVNVKMLGGFSIEYKGASINDSSNRMRKVWLLLAYLICNRNHVSTQEHYLSLIQNAGSGEGDPSGKLKALFYRVRSMLNDLDPSAGHDWIIRKDGTYAWNGEVAVSLDVEDFEDLCRKADKADDADTSLALYREALSVYRGDFLPKLDMESWVVPISAFYHQMYLNAVQRCLFLLEKRSLWNDACLICRESLKVEPYSEELYQHLMRSLIALDDRSAALAAYDEMSEMLFSTFGVMPSEESRSIYRDACNETGEKTVSGAEMRDQLKEPFGARGAMLCQYDFFKMLYQLQARSIVRSGEVIHIALFSVHGQEHKALPRRSLDRVMENLQELLVNNLRQGDVVTRCTISQFIVMLPQANYEDSCAVCRRLLKSFKKQYPHSPAEISFSVQPLEPKLPESAALN